VAGQLPEPDFLPASSGHSRVVGTGLFALEHGELLSKSGGLQTEAVPWEAECAKVGAYRKN
jgi:hypothetical protein